MHYHAVQFTVAGPLIDWVAYLDSQGVALKSLHESIDTLTSTGKLVFHLFGSLAGFERNLIQDMCELTDNQLEP